MGYFEGMTKGSFKKDKGGKTVFFPWGILGKGLVLPDESTERNVRGFVSRFYKIGLPTIIGVGVIVGWIWSFVLLPPFGLWFYLGIKPLVSDCPYSEDKLTPKESYLRSASGHSRFILWLLLICCLLFVLGGFIKVVTAESSGRMIIGGLVIIFFGACGAAIGYMLRVKNA